MVGNGQANGHRFTGALPISDARLDPARRPDPAALAYDLEAATAAVLALRSTVPDDAFTAGVLGTEREGNGVLIGADGLVLTIGYLVTEAESVTLTDIGGRSTPATVVAYDQETGFGIVRALGPLAATPLPMGGARDLTVGQRVVLAAGGGPRQALQAELVSKREFAGYWEYLLDEALFTAPPHPRWSGAALLDDAGRLCGIGSLFVQDARDETETTPGNMFVPTDLLAPILPDLLRTGRSASPPRPWLGMFAAEGEESLIVAGLVQGGPAHRAGIRMGDAVLAVEGRRVRQLADFYRRIWAQGEPGTPVTLRLAREGRPIEATVRTGNRYDRLKRPARN